LSTVLHELGNAMGFPEDMGQDVTGMLLSAGVRTLPVPTGHHGRASDVDQRAEVPPHGPVVAWTDRHVGEPLPDQAPATGWLDDFLNHAGQDHTHRNPNAGIRLRVPG
ncbi:MAG: hypothetical protein AB7O80_22960, partial [Acetobacteraceae bacterium]